MSGVQRLESVSRSGPGQATGRLVRPRQLDHELANAGFLRVHRRYVVNLGRVREVERRDRGEFILVMDDNENTVVPVSRRNAGAVRRALGI